MAAEAKNPRKNLPLAVFGTIFIVTLLYCLASWALVGMEYYPLIDPDSGFSIAFRDNGWLWAADLIAIGEIVTLPLAALVSMIAQPRIQFALSKAQLLPKAFGELDKHGNLQFSIIFSGIVCILVAMFIPSLTLMM